MPSNVQDLRPKPPETEKITINLGYVDLGHVDLMVKDGFYSNRTDFIRTAIRNQLERHADVVKQSTARKGLDLGLRNYTRADLEAARQAGEMLHINVLGLATIAQDVSPDLARERRLDLRRRPLRRRRTDAGLRGSHPGHCRSDQGAEVTAACRRTT